LDGAGGADFYDISNVDGNTIGMTIQPMAGHFTKVNDPSLGKFNCGTVCVFFTNNQKTNT
jgi:hypothetical protein